MENQVNLIQEFGSLGIVGFVVYWMMKRIDICIKSLQSSIEHSKTLQASISNQNVAIVETQVQILQELKNLRIGLDKTSNNQ